MLHAMYGDVGPDFALVPTWHITGTKTGGLVFAQPRTSHQWISRAFNTSESWDVP